MKEVVLNQTFKFNQRLIQIAMIGCLMASTAMASPDGASVVMGDVSILDQGKSAVTVEQKSARAVINWKSFDTKKDESITFKQPDASAIAVNIVTDKSPTNFQGSLEANGKIILINNNGIVFSKTSHVDVAGMIATTMQIDMESFADKDQVNFTADKDMKLDAKVENKGTITVAQAGLVGLVAPIVKNSGIIQAELGTVHLASGNAFTVDMVGDGLVSLAVSAELEGQLIEHKGEIYAKGGKVYMTAAVAEKMVDDVINVKGLVEAQTVEVKQGKILIEFAKEEPVVEEVAAEEPVVEEVVAEEPAPVIEEPVVEEVAAEEPAPVVEEPVVEEVVAEEPAPVIEEPLVEEVAAEEPVLADPDSNEIKIDLSSLQIEDSIERRRGRVLRRIKEWYVGIVRPGDRSPETIRFDTYAVRLGDLSIFETAKSEDDRI